jgi:uncharacterized protein (TIGR02594 family)
MDLLAIFRRQLFALAIVLSATFLAASPAQAVGQYQADALAACQAKLAKIDATPTGGGYGTHDIKQGCVVKFNSNGLGGGQYTFIGCGYSSLYGYVCSPYNFYFKGNGKRKKPATTDPATANAQPDGNCDDCDPATAGGGTGPEFGTKYSSQPGHLDATPATQAAGPMRSHTYSRAVTILVPDIHGVLKRTAYLLRQDGSTEQFTDNNGAWVGQFDNFSTLQSILDGQGQLTGYQSRRENGDLETYDANGRLLSITDRANRTRTLTYTAAGELESVTDDAGRALIFSYDEFHHITRIDQADGRFVLFAYNADGMLSQITRADGSVRKYLYGETGLVASSADDMLLTGIVDENNNRIRTNKYNSAFRLVETSGNNGLDKFTMAYTNSSDGTYAKTTVVTTPLGETRTINTLAVQDVTYTSGMSRACTGCTTRSMSRTVDAANGLPDTVTDFEGGITDNDYSATGLPTKVTAAKSTAIQQVTDIAWDATLRVPTQIDRAGQRATFTYNARGQVLTATVIDLTVTPNVARTSTYTWCEQADVTAGTCPRVGLLRSIDGPRSDVSDVTYFYYRAADQATCATNPTGCPYRKGDLYRIVNPAGQSTYFYKRDGAGRLTQLAEANGIYTDYEYSPRGQLTATKVRGVDDTTEADDAITRVEYFAHGKVKKVTRPDGSSVAFTYDAAQRLTDVTDGLGNAIHFTLDAAGNRTAEDTKNNGGVVKRTLSSVFDALGQLAQAKNAAGQATLFSYDKNGALDLASDPLNHTSDSDVDALGRLKKQIQDVAGIAATSQFTYDARDNLTQVLDPKNLATNYAYNGFDEVTQLTSPDSGVSSYTYDAAGNLASKTDARLVTSTFTYDALGRVLSQSVPTSAQNATFAYDAAPADCQLGETFATGRLSVMTDESGNTRYCYDRWGNLVRKVQQVTQGTTLTTGATYNSAGQLVAMTYPSGAIVTYQRDGNGRITRVDANPSAGAAQVNIVQGVTYAPFGPMTDMTFGNGRIQSRAYDQDYGIDAVTETNGTDGFTGDYGLDAVGNVTSVTERGTLARTYGYDGLDRVGSVTGGATAETFTYDATGNRLTKGTLNYSYPSTSHKLSSVGGNVRTYDAMGNTLTMPESSAMVMTYDDRGRLATVSTSSGWQRTYHYNGKGERVLREHPTSTSWLQYVYDEDGHLIGEYNSAGTRVAEYVWMDDTLVAVLKSHSGTTYQFVLTDHLGTPRAIVKPTTNTVVWRWDLTGSAFGDHAVNSDPDGDATLYAFNLRYPGQYYDGLGSVYYNYFRDYDSRTGRYLQSDPIGQAGGVSTYSYVGSRPSNAVDPLGLFGFEPQRANQAYLNMLADVPIEVFGAFSPTPPWIGTAYGELGVRENTSKKIHNPRVVEYHSATFGYKDDETPWCASFVNWTLRENQLAGTGHPGASRFLGYGNRLDDPALGAIGVIVHSNGSGHVGYIVGRTSDGKLVMLGGNQSNMVSTIAVSRSQIAGYVFPPGYVPNPILPLISPSASSGSTR